LSFVDGVLWSPPVGVKVTATLSFHIAGLVQRFLRFPLALISSAA
jgi:hypothetical protein